MFKSNPKQSPFSEILAREAPALSRGHALTVEIVTVLTGVVLLALLAQVEIRLPWTIVPITGQTFGVAFLALLLGARRAFSTVAAYLGVGALGLPVFTLGQSGLTLGPTLGYLVGMLVASLIVGILSDRGWAKSFWSALLSAYIGSVFIFGFGLVGLSLFVSSENLLQTGLWPFIPGDFIKNVLAAMLVTRLRVVITKHRP